MKRSLDDLEMLVRHSVSQVLSIPPSAFDPATALADYGLDSIGMLDLIVQLEEDLGIRLRYRDRNLLQTVNGIVEHIRASEQALVVRFDSLIRHRL
ncbi:acyl carrier protein [Gordonia sp. ABSL49_1]|mgnify:CR=1 FL=1|uniref:acyl carrier protein n=1 Tax=Gordonia sp. ABSL49_1 TaxID=2920941 RepID=UPI001F10BD54|nr:acyl carrier protein [Gordonia sp. ABSL49_1]MCH5642190.1 acyl carrier protein [Gordonia sp. ABSL49_1]